MSLFAILFIVLIVLLFYIKKKITDLTENIEEKLDIVKQIATHPKEIATSVTEAVADTALTQASKLLKTTTKKK